jgi:pimeloyl-ACP methyl ester carboxylesterase
MSDFVVSARKVHGAVFKAEPGPSRFLVVPADAQPDPGQGRVGKQWIDAWLKQVLAEATWGTDARTGNPRGDILIHVHGYNNSPADMIGRHRRLLADLRGLGWLGALVSFDWPSDDTAIGYLEDRHDAKQTAMQLVTDLIRLLAAKQTADCTINIHLLAHSMGAYVVREAFDDADDARLDNNAWMTSQVCLIGGDVSAASLRQGGSSGESLYRHCIRLTNYWSHHDSVLKLSNAKRIGMAPRVGRVGLPKDAPPAAVNVDCSDYHGRLLSEPALQQQDQPHGFNGNQAHSWYIGNLHFTRDLFETLRGDLDRAVIPTREVNADGSLRLR